jgi:predicted double-glycine peptidase
MLPVKPFRQTSGFCGPASLKIVLEYYGIHKTEKELVKLTGCTKKTGTSAKGILDAAKKCGLKGNTKDNTTLKDIKSYLTKKIPVIVDWFSEDEGHYSVVVGLDKKKIYLQDPERGHLKTIPIETFMRIWFDFSGEYLKSKKDLILRRLIIVYP